MKSISLLILLLLFIKFTFAQEGENPLPYVMQEPKYDTAPQFPGGSAAMLKYFNDSIRYPQPEKGKQLQGSVYLKFIVTKKGKVTNVELLNGVPGGPNLAREAVRLIQNMPDWFPATKNGKPVDAEYYLSIPFKL